MYDFIHGKSHVVPRFRQPLQEIRLRSTPIAKPLQPSFVLASDVSRLVQSRRTQRQRDGYVVPVDMCPRFLATAAYPCASLSLFTLLVLTGVNVSTHGCFGLD